MTNADDAARLRELCEQASKEYDGDKLLELVRKINELVDKAADSNPPKPNPETRKTQPAYARQETRTGRTRNIFAQNLVLLSKAITHLGVP